MTHKKIVEIDGTERIVDLSEEDLGMIAEQNLFYQSQMIKAEANEKAKATAQAKLAALGLTTEDLQALGL
jgi:hypothetical protein